MSSTDASHSTELIRAFHSNELMPLAHELRRRGKTVFPSGPDGSAPTYYISRAKPAMDKADFEVYGPGSVEDFEKALAELWTRQGFPELVLLAGGLAAIAGSVYFAEERDEEVSPFIYVMF